MARRVLSKDDVPLYVITLGHALTHWYPSIFYVLLPLLKDQLGLSFAQIGVLMTMRAVSSTLVNLPGGAIVDMVGRRGLLMGISLAWCGVPYFFLGLSTNYALILACMGVMGLGNNLWHPAAISQLSDTYAERRGWALSIHSLGANFGDTIGPLTAGFLLVYLAYEQMLFVNLLPGLVMAALFFLWLRGHSAGEGRSLSLAAYWSGFKELARDSGVMLLSLVGGLRAMTQNGLSTFLPLYLAGLGMGPALIGTYLAVVQFSGLIASPISGAMSDRMGRKPLVAGGMLATSVMVIVLANLTWITLPGIDFTWIFVGVLSLLGFFLFALRPAMQAWTMDMVPNRMGGTAVGLMFGSQALFSSFSPTIGGILADHFGLISAFYFLAGTILLANVIVLLVPDRVLDRQPAPVPVTA